MIDIDMMASNKHACPNVRKGVKLLKLLKQAVNEQSDGWAYFTAARKSADKLMQLLGTVGNPWYDTYGTITDKQLKDAVTPIRRMVTVQHERQKKYGNTFNFDVDAAFLADPPPAPAHTSKGIRNYVAVQSCIAESFDDRITGKDFDRDLASIIRDLATPFEKAADPLDGVHRRTYQSIADAFEQIAVQLEKSGTAVPQTA